MDAVAGRPDCREILKQTGHNEKDIKSGLIKESDLDAALKTGWGQQKENKAALEDMKRNFQLADGARTNGKNDQLVCNEDYQKIADDKKKGGQPPDTARSMGSGLNVQS